jgi:hypothetical protein
VKGGDSLSAILSCSRRACDGTFILIIDLIKVSISVFRGAVRLRLTHEQLPLLPDVIAPTANRAQSVTATKQHAAV